MALFQKDQPGSAAGGHHWTEPGQIIEILDEKLAADLRKMAHAGIREVFSKPDEPAVKRTPVTETDPAKVEATAAAAPKVADGLKAADAKPAPRAGK
jgi:hypothetical protein